MKLHRPAVSVYTVPTDAPEADGTLAWDSTTMVIAQVSAGEATGLGWTYGSAAVADFVRGHLAPLVEGRDALDIPATHDAMCRSVRNAGRPGIAACAISAVDIALWDLKARLLGLPLARLLGVCRERVPVYGSGGFTSYHDTHMAAQLNGWVHGQHIPRVKIKIGGNWGREVTRDLSRVHAARQVIGADAELYVDANGAYTRKQAIRVGHALAEQGVGWFEEPVSSDDLTGLRLVRDALVCDVAAGEYGYDLPYFARMITAGAVDCLQADATRCGGLTEFLRAAALAHAHGLEISAHCAPHVHAAAAASIPNVRHLEWFHDHVRIEDMFFDGALDPTGGMVQPLTGIGHGLELRTDDVAKYRVA
ncbi:MULTISPECIES: enolase C-terminal domain-like protein [Streptomyces]|jgi:L-alanine-DL-glutamate epimerase-like enolase superfamily enzyme|uniref:enolase C-terminal domain-like protein n=1 Tax=Streptomyces TaxID=1883 RepID=UPI000D3A811F|nr:MULTISPECIES: enolase C-terminal domain-like protein [Streptomyces]MBY8345962.1 mandelate racemase [Streptomyces plumbidurans]PTM99956.1 L-alanine-DL-glutamate epimerase-like enolase superfamily enzyme [Streptomyces sp. VMFN-G11Ma]